MVSPLADDEAKLTAFAARLADGIEAHLGDWVKRTVAETAAQAGRDPADFEVAANQAASVAVVDVAKAVRVLLETDVDRQPTTPLALLRRAVSYPTQVLVANDVALPERPEFDVRSFPDDLYGLTPATFGDIAPELHELGLEWGAAKAYVHLCRRSAQDAP